MACRGDLAAPTVFGPNTNVLGTMVPLYSRIGCHAPNGVDTNWQPGEIYGIISGNGNPSAGEITAMENFLAGHAGFTPLP
jgi:hypothetical protein